MTSQRVVYKLKYMNNPGKLRSIKKIREFWQPQTFYWYFHIGPSKNFIPLIKRTLSKYLKSLPANFKILDIAAGANNAVYYPKNFKMENVYALDICPSNLKVNPSGHKIIADARKHLPFQSTYFDMIISIFGFRYFENQEEIINNLINLLKSNCWLLLIDYKRLNNAYSIRVFDIYQLEKIIKNDQIKTKITKRLYSGSRYIPPLDFFTIKKM